MVASAGILLLKTKPYLLHHAPVGSGSATYDFDGRAARIKRVKLVNFRAASTSSYAYITIGGVSVTLVAVGSETVAAAASDGETIADEWKGCLEVPVGTVFTWNYSSCFFMLLEFELL